MVARTTSASKSFYAFLGLVLVTAFLPFFSVTGPLHIGLLAIIWGFFGFFRLVYLSHYQNTDIPKFLNLPIQILFGSSNQEQQKRKLILQRLAQPDILLWLVGTMLYVMRMVYYLLYVGTPDVNESMMSYVMITQLAFVGMLVTMIFLVLSYSQKRSYLKIMAYLFVPLIAVSFIMALGASDNPQAISAWGARYGQLGFMGAVGVYLLALPAIAMFVKILFNVQRTFLKPFLGLLCLILLLVLDRFVSVSDWSMACTILLLTTTAFLWGHTVRYRL